MCEEDYITLKDKYILWNKALVDNFINSDSTVIYVTGNVIEEIGEKYGITKDVETKTYKDDFIKTFTFFLKREGKTNEKNRIDYNKIKRDLFNAWYLMDYKGKGQKDKELSDQLSYNNTLFDFAVFLTTHKITDNIISTKELQFLYFPYVILILLGFNQSNDQDQSKDQVWSGIVKFLKDNNIYFSVKEREKVALLFEALIRDKALNEQCTYTKNSHIKYLKYHSVLRPSERNLFESILFEHNILWEKGSTYNEIRRIVWNHIGNDRIREALRDNNTRPYFEQIIKTFNPQKYRMSIGNVNNEGNRDREKGTFRFIIDLEQSCTGIWTRYVNIEEELHEKGEFVITTDEILPHNFVVEGNLPDWKKYSSHGLKYEDKKYNISSKKQKEDYYFEILENRWLLEEDVPEKLEGEPYFHVSNGQHQGLSENMIQDESITKFFGKGYNVYYSNSYHHAEIKELDAVEHPHKYAKINRSSGIKIGKDYLPDAFPYIEYEGIDAEDIIIRIKSTYDSHEISFKKKILGNRIYLYDFGKIETNEINVTIFDNENNRIDDCADAKNNFYVKSNCENKDIEYVHFDKWNLLTTNNNNYYSDNIVHPLPTNGKINLPQSNITPRQKLDKPYNRLMGILYTIGNEQKVTKNNAIRKELLDATLTYVAEFEGITLSNPELYRLKSALCELGVISEFYKEGHLYQISSTRLVPIKEKISTKEVTTREKMTRDESIKYYILYGAYSKNIYEEAKKEAIDIIYIDHHDRMLKLLPPISIFGYNDDYENMLICEDITPENLLSFVGSISGLENDPIITGHKMTSKDNVTNNHYPIIEAVSDNGVSWKKKKHLRISDNEIINNDAIPLDLLYNFVQYKKREPMWIECGDGNIYFKREWHLPFFVKKALTLSNCNLALNAFAFGVDNFLDEKNVNSLFTPLYYYKIWNAEKQLKNCMGDENSTVANFIKDINKLKLIGYKQLDKSVNKWWIVLQYNEEMIAFTDKESRKVYMKVDKNNFNNVTNGKDNINNVNSILSSIINLYFEKNEFFKPIAQWYGDYNLKIDDQDTKDAPSNYGENIEKYDIIIMKKKYEAKRL